MTNPISMDPITAIGMLREGFLDSAPNAIAASQPE